MEHTITQGMLHGNFQDHSTNCKFLKLKGERIIIFVVFLDKTKHFWRVASHTP